jgi:hypothetical protein
MPLGMFNPEFRTRRIRDLLVQSEESRIPVLSREAATIFRGTGVSLLFDDTSLMRLWRNSISGFVKELEVQDVPLRLFGLHTESAGRIGLYDLDRNGQEQSLQDVSDRKNPGVVFVLSPCMAPAWEAGSVQGSLRQLGEEKFVGIVPLRSRYIWGSTALGYGQGIRANTIGGQETTNNRGLLDVQEANLRTNMVGENTALLPTVALEESSMDIFTGAVSEKSGIQVHAVNFPLDEMRLQYVLSVIDATEEEIPPLSPRENVRLFLASASRLRRDLAYLMAGVPLDIEIAEKIRREMLPDADENHFADIVLSRIAQVKKKGEDGVRYDFIPGVRNHLIAGSLRSHTFRALQIAGDVLAQRHPGEHTFEQLKSGIIHSQDAAWISDIAINEITYSYVKNCALSLHAMGGTSYWELGKRLDVIIKKYENERKQKNS